jgi:hypothetical protein
MSLHDVVDLARYQLAPLARLVRPVQTRFAKMGCLGGNK